MKVGDKVKVTEKRSRSSKLLNGKICTIARIYGDHACGLKEETDVIRYGGVWFDELTLMPNKINTPKEML